MEFILGIIFFFFIPTYKKYKTHIIRVRPNKVCPILYNARLPDMRRLGLPLTKMQRKMDIASNNQGEPFEIYVLDEKRKQFAIHVLLLFIPWRILKDRRVKNENDWWPAFCILEKIVFLVIRARSISETNKVGTMFCVVHRQLFLKYEGAIFLLQTKSPCKTGP